MACKRLVETSAIVCIFMTLPARLFQTQMMVARIDQALDDGM